MTAPLSIGKAMDGMLLRREIMAAIRTDPGTGSACLATVVIGDNPRCHILARGRRSAAAEVGMRSTKVDLTGTATQAEVEDAISILATDAGVHGIFVQLPFPVHLDHEVITRLVPPVKDVDGMDPDGPHPPTTALAVVRLLDRFDVPITGRRVVVVGRVRGMERLLVGRGADVTVTDKATPDTCRPADILIAGAGRPGTIGSDHIRPGATVVDVTGDVDLDQALTVAGAVAPYPTTVGPVAVACLLRNTLDATQAGPVTGPGTDQLLIHRHLDGRLRRIPDEVAVEEPLEIRLDGHLVATTLRTPGNDHELAVGLLHAEGLLDGIVVTRVHHCFDDRQSPDRAADGATVELNVITVDTGGRASVPPPRLQTATAACGLCGSTSIAELTSRLQALPPTGMLPDDVVLAIGDRVRSRQGLFGTTGGVHAAAVFDAGGEPLLIREDVGRHNAVDKLVGRMRLDDRLPAAGLGLFVSGRAGFELVQKAWAAGFAWMVAVGAPTSLAVRTARTAGLVLVGFASDHRFNLYAPVLPLSVDPIPVHPLSGDPVITLVLGGARSGKSVVGERLAAALGPDVTYVATAVVDPGDDDFASRVRQHRDRRPPSWTTVEAGADLPAILSALHGPALVDSLGTWVAACADPGGPSADHDALCQALARRAGDTVVVSEEVGLGVHPSSESGRHFRDVLGTVNQAVAGVAGDVLLVVAGRVLPLARP